MLLNTDFRYSVIYCYKLNIPSNLMSLEAAPIMTLKSPGSTTSSNAALYMDNSFEVKWNVIVWLSPFFKAMRWNDFSRIGARERVLKVIKKHKEFFAC